MTSSLKYQSIFKGIDRILNELEIEILLSYTTYLYKTKKIAFHLPFPPSNLITLQSFLFYNNSFNDSCNKNPWKPKELGCYMHIHYIYAQLIIIIGMYRKMKQLKIIETLNYYFYLNYYSVNIDFMIREWLIYFYNILFK